MSTLLGTYASGIWDDLGQPSGISPYNISGYIISNLGKLNILIDTSFSGDAQGNVIPELSIYELAIAGEMYKESYYARQVRDSLGAAGYGKWIMIKDEGTTIQRASPTQIAREFSLLKDDARKNIMHLSDLYKRNLVQVHNIEFVNVYERYVAPNEIAQSLFNRQT